MTSETPIKQILQQQAELVTHKYTNYFTDPISPNMISPWQQSVKKNRFSNLKDNDLRRLSDFRHNYSKQNSSAYRSIMELQTNQNQNFNHDIQNQEQFSTSYVLHSMTNDHQNLQNLSRLISKKNKYQDKKQKLKKAYTQEDNFQKTKSKWNEWKDEDQYRDNDNNSQSQKKMFQTLSTLNKKQLNKMNHNSNQKTKKINLNRKKLQTTVIDINQNADFNARNKFERTKQLLEKNYQYVNNFCKLNYNYNYNYNQSQKCQIKNSNKKQKQNRSKRFFNKFYFDFSVFGFKNGKSQITSNTQKNIQSMQLKDSQHIRDNHLDLELSLDLQKSKKTSKNDIKIRQIPKKIKIKNIQEKRHVDITKRQKQVGQKRRCRTDQNIQKNHNVYSKSGQKRKQFLQDSYNSIHPGSIVINLNKMLEQQVKPMPTLNKMTQSSVYKKLRKTLCF